MRRWLYSWWMRLRGYRRYVVDSSEGKFHCWAKRTEDGDYLTYRGVSDNGRRFEMTGYNPEKRVVRGWYRDTPYDPRFPYKTGEGITDDGRKINYYGVVPPQEGRG